MSDTVELFVVKERESCLAEKVTELVSPYSLQDSFSDSRIHTFPINVARLSLYLCLVI